MLRSVSPLGESLTTERKDAAPSLAKHPEGLLQVFGEFSAPLKSYVPPVTLLQNSCLLVLHHS